MELALADAELQPADIRQINAHGTSTPLNDAAEAEAVTKVFGDARPTGGLDQRASPATRSAPPARWKRSPSLLSIEHRLIPPTAGTTDVVRRHDHRPRDGRSPAAGSRGR